ncbi:helix-turn-helix domain-containing protein [Virgibacillus litoralis]|uniref:Transcriptional regulator with XRE-family HTH domain n=1 Tax=Virgibacillus litoralis TaxID=578221 RepID=A0ABS4HH42_9BACI|nr:helix-turn-helix transcriptional regulator [Virgibacillus litoralis]MBP1950247.1 transcriptional regulator with XRE-family HTH domain [Virgibacillus litoralis]
MFPKRLKYLRKLRGYSQEGLGNKINATKSTISNYENDYSTPSNDVLKDIADVLHTTTDYLLGRTEKINESENEEFDSLSEINRLIKEFGIDQSGFFDVEKWKNMGPEEIKELENYFEYITEKAQKKNLDQDSFKKS